MRYSLQLLFHSLLFLGKFGELAYLAYAPLDSFDLLGIIASEDYELKIRI